MLKIEHYVTPCLIFNIAFCIHTNLYVHLTKLFYKNVSKINGNQDCIVKLSPSFGSFKLSGSKPSRHWYVL